MTRIIAIVVVLAAAVVAYMYSSSDDVDVTDVATSTRPAEEGTAATVDTPLDEAVDSEEVGDVTDLQVIGEPGAEEVVTDEATIADETETDVIETEEGAVVAEDTAATTEDAAEPEGEVAPAAGEDALATEVTEDDIRLATPDEGVGTEIGGIEDPGAPSNEGVMAGIPDEQPETPLQEEVATVEVETPETAVEVAEPSSVVVEPVGEDGATEPTTDTSQDALSGAEPGAPENSPAVETEADVAEPLDVTDESAPAEEAPADAVAAIAEAPAAEAEDTAPVDAGPAVVIADDAATGETLDPGPALRVNEPASEGATAPASLDTLLDPEALDVAAVIQAIQASDLDPALKAQLAQALTVARDRPGLLPDVLARIRVALENGQ